MLLNTSTSALSVPDYLSAIDFLFRMKSEGKVSDTTIELFSLLYGETCYEVLFAQGFFKPELN